MSQALLVVLDPDSIATLEPRLDTRISVGRLPRLAKLLSSRDGDIDVSVTIHRGDDEFPRIEGRLTANLDLVCQRCLEPMRLPVQTKFNLVLIAEGSEPVAAESRYEPYYLTEHRADRQGTRLLDIIEDELLLVLPFSPMHADREACGRLAGRLEDFEEAEKESSTYRPFDVLKDRNLD